MASVKFPPNYARIKTVASFEELMATPFEDGVNALCWERSLEGNFEEVVHLLEVGEGINTVESEDLLSLSLSQAGKTAVQALIDDQRLLQERGLEPILDCVNHYERDAADGPIRTDVFSFHCDSATVEADTYLCTYYGAPSEGLRNDEAQKCIEIPRIRAALVEHFGGIEGPEFEEYLSDQCFNLHYFPLPGARPFSFGIGNLWRIAIEHPHSPVPPCIHRAPATNPGQRRLLLIS
jgi:hypothetical protein